MVAAGRHAGFGEGGTRRPTIVACAHVRQAASTTPQESAESADPFVAAETALVGVAEQLRAVAAAPADWLVPQMGSQGEHER
jgi:hypothetical protein